LVRKGSAAGGYDFYFTTIIETPMVKNLRYYQSYVQFVDAVNSTTDKEYFESEVCGIESRALNQYKVDSSTIRLEMMRGQKKFGDIKTGRWTAISD